MTAPISDEDLSILRDNIEAHPGGVWTGELTDIAELVARIDYQSGVIRSLTGRLAAAESELDELRELTSDACLVAEDEYDTW